MSPAIAHLVANWKTSLQGVLSAVIAVGLALTAAPQTILTGKQIGAIVLAVAVAKALLGFVQSDARPAVTSSTTIEITQPVKGA